MTDLTALTAPIRAREEAATKGPWRTWIDNGERRGAAVETSWSHDADGSDTELITDWCSPSDAEFIAHARTDVPRLLQALEGAEAALARYAAAMDETSKRLNQQVLDRDIHRDPEAAIRYSNYASAADVVLRNFRAAVVAALGEGA